MTTFETFNEDQCEIRQAYNRCMIISNLKEDKGQEEAQAYYDQFPVEEQMKMVFLMETAKKFGVETMTKRVKESIEAWEEESHGQE
jgi:hypothetical protein